MPRKPRGLNGEEACPREEERNHVIEKSVFSG